MPQQFVHNVQPGPREFVTTQAGAAQRQGVTNGGRPAALDLRHLDFPGHAAPAVNATAHSDFEVRARAHVAMIDLYANQLAVSGTIGAGVTVDDLKLLPLARLQALALALPATKPAANAGQPGDDFAGYSLNDAIDATLKRAAEL